MTFKSRTAYGALALAATLVATLAGCGHEGPEALMASAKVFIAKNDSRAAVIQLKNVLQNSPDQPEARFLLGQALLQGGDVIGAEVELRKALALLYPHDQVDPLLAKTLLQQQQFKKLTDEFATSLQTSPRSVALVQTSLAEAYGALKQLPEADAAVRRALQADPANAEAGVASARLQGVHRDPDGALKTLADVIARGPDAAESAEAYKLRGDILQFSKGQTAEAMTAYRKAVALQPDLVLGHVAIIELLLGQNNLTDAARELDVMKKLATGHAQERYLEARLAYQKKDFKLARDLCQGLLKSFPGNASVLQMAAVIEFDAYSSSQAVAYANRALELDPTLSVARRTLINAYLRTGQTDRAMTALIATTDAAGQVPPDMFALAGQVYLESRNMQKAEEYFSKASQASPTDVVSRTSLAVTRLARGEGDAALDQLQAIANTDKGTTADLALVSAYLARNDFDRALAAVDKLGAKQPASAMAPNLRGRILFLRRDLPAARASFEKAAGLDPSLYPPVAALVSLDMGARQPDAAKKRLDDFLVRNPDNLLAATTRVEVAVATDAPTAEVVERIGKIISAYPGEAAPRLQLVNYYLQRGRVKEARSAADDATAAVPNDPGVLDVQGRSQMAAGEVIRAQDTFAKMASLQPQSPLPQMRIAEAYVAARNLPAAQDSLRKSLRIEPTYLQAQFALVTMAVADKRWDDALAIAKTVQQQRPKEAAGFMMEGDVDYERAKFDAAAAAYRTGLTLGQSPQLAIKLHATLTHNARNAEADALIRDWTRDHPADPFVPSYLGDLALARRDYAVAEAHYRAVVALEPKNATVYNNLAWVVHRQGKPGALALAETADKLQPHQPSFLDTMAQLIGDAQDYKRALELQNEAVSLAPQAPEFKLGRARLLIKSGDKAGAKADLEALAKLGAGFKGQAEVTALLKQT